MLKQKTKAANSFGFNLPYLIRKAAQMVLHTSEAFYNQGWNGIFLPAVSGKA